MAGLFASLGLGRFSLGMMLPSMGEALALTYSQMGMISTVNFCGYLMVVLFCGVMTARFGARVVISVALAVVSLSMVLIGFSSSYRLILLLYCLTGIGSALSNVPIMALIAAWFDDRSRGRAAGLCVMRQQHRYIGCRKRGSGAEQNGGWLADELDRAWLSCRGYCCPLFFYDSKSAGGS